jgi:hypothetical protein
MKYSEVRWERREPESWLGGGQGRREAFPSRSGLPPQEDTDLNQTLPTPTTKGCQDASRAPAPFHKPPAPLAPEGVIFPGTAHKHLAQPATSADRAGAGGGGGGLYQCGPVPLPQGRAPPHPRGAWTRGRALCGEGWSGKS